MPAMWEFFEAAETRWYRWKLDGAALWLKKNGEEWRIAASAIPFKSIADGAEGPSLSETAPKQETSISVAAGKRVALRPHPSPTPYSISARNSIRLLPGTEVSFTISLPPLLRLELESGQALWEGYPFATATTWFGDTKSGTVCLSLPIDLDPEGEGAAGGANPKAAKYLSCRSLIRCRIQVKNRSRDPLDVKRLAIFTDFMNIYRENDALVSSAIVITGNADGSLQTGIDDSGHARLQKLHSAPKTGLNELLIKRGASFLRSVAGR